MGDLIGEAVGGTLYYAPEAEMRRVRALNVEVPERVALFADLCRLNALYMIARAGSGHIGSSFSCMDLLSWLHLVEMRQGHDGGPKDRYFSSKGHDAPALYAVLMGLGQLPFELIHRLRQVDGLPGHPDVSTGPIVTNTGSLGMGISKAKGMAIAQRHQGQRGQIFVLTGDGELQEGQIWESLISAANRGLHEVTAIVDHNKLQSDTFVSETSDLGSLMAKFQSFGWHAVRTDGHDLQALNRVFASLRGVTDRPKVVVADTIKGRGVSFMEHTALESDAALYRFHSGAPDAESYTRAAQELLDRIRRRTDELSVEPVALESVEAPTRPAPRTVPQRLIPAYGEALREQGQKRSDLIVLDADLAVDTGQQPFRKEFPERFIECGIAEMDMVSQAGGLALGGLLPVCHSFACFLSTRPNEQIYNNATERTRIVYVASLAGVLPGGPGHSHQSVRDISALGAVPGLTMIEPCTEAEVRQAVDWCVHRAPQSAYLRLVSVPWSVPFTLPRDYYLQEGRGVALTDGDDAAMFGYGPVLLSEAHQAVQKLRDEHGVGVKLINLPWLNRFDADWLADAVGERTWVFTLDNHYVHGGQGDGIAAALLERGVVNPRRLQRLGLRDIPVSGESQDVLRAHGLDAQSLVDAVVRAL